MRTQDEAIKAVQLAVKHIGQGNMVSSARLCLTDAVHNLGQGQWQYAWERALRSISYSVGMFHDDHRSLVAPIQSP